MLPPIGGRRLRDLRRRRATPPLRHPGTASERSAGRRIRDPCLARRAPVHDEAVARRRRSTVAAVVTIVTASSSVVPPSVVASRRHLRRHFVGWRIDGRHLRRPSSNPTQWGGGAERSEAEGGPRPPSRDGERSARPAWRGLSPCSRASTARGSPARRTWPDRPPPSRPSAAGGSATAAAVAPPLRHPGTASERSAGRRIRDPCLAVGQIATAGAGHRPARLRSVRSRVAAGPRATSASPGAAAASRLPAPSAGPASPPSPCARPAPDGPPPRGPPASATP
jgi:hypothetical protein